MTLEHAGALAVPVENLSDTNAFPAMGDSESVGWTQNQVRQVYRVRLGRRNVKIETSGVDLPEWLHQAIAELNQIAELREDWDSYRALTVPQRTIEHALATLMRLVDSGLPLPQIHPTPQGGIAFGWHVPGRDLEVTVERPFVVHAYYRDDARPEDEWEGAVGLDLEEITDRGALIRP